MVWDTALPLGTESKSLGDDRIREFKTDVQTSLRAGAASGTEAIFPGADTSNPVFRYRGLKGTSVARPAAGDYGLYFNETTNQIQRDNGSSWVDVGTHIPSGTVMCFFQAAVPTGWTQVTTQDDKAFRVVSGTGGGAGGTLAFSGGASHSHTVDSHTHDLANHTHTGPSHTHTVSRDGWSFTVTETVGRLVTSDGTTTESKAANGISTGAEGTGATGVPSSNTSGAATPGTDTQAPVLAYIDMILGSKD